VAWSGIVVALDPGGDHPAMFDGPGLTVDEPFNVAQGVGLVDRLFAGDLPGFRQVDARLPDHPPLGRVWIGLCHEIAWILYPPIDRTVPYSVTCARTAPALAFAALIVLVGVCAGRWYGRWGGAAAALALVLMPRVFGHAHLAALETLVNLTCTAAVLYLAEKWGAPANSPGGAAAQVPGPLSWNHALITAAIGGALFGLALLTKVQAILLPVPVAVWALLRMRGRAVPALALWGLTGVAVFFGLWPHLWSAPVDHFFEYLGRTTNRPVIQVWYFGQVIPDREVPWHYPWIIFLATVPLGLHALGFAGLFGPEKRAWNAPRELLVLACGVFPLVVFSIPGVAVYDGERLFSNVFPLWAVFIGRGAEFARLRLSLRWSPRAVGLALALVFAAQGYGLVALAPCWLSYYNLAIGGLPGAAKLGLEISYWGDGLTRTLLSQTASRVPQGEHLAVLPTLYALQWNEVRMQSPPLKRRDVELMPYDESSPREERFVLMFMRPEYLPEEFRNPLDEHRILAVVRRQGVLLAALYDHD
jgi:4-amino-4-deoxy-L-arabinose transferase-like glycosyltransferase